jgi:hypothetical protein
MSNYTKMNQQLPIFTFGKGKDESLLAKYLDEGIQSNIFINLDHNPNEEERKYTKSHGYNTRSTNRVVTMKIRRVDNDKVFADLECRKVLENALKEAIGENDKVSNSIQGQEPLRMLIFKIT